MSISPEVNTCNSPSEKGAAPAADGRVRRRSLVRAAAWSVPVVVTSAALPAVAASGALALAFSTLPD